MSDDQIEQMIQEKGLNAPRVTPQRIEGVIVSEHYSPWAPSSRRHSVGGLSRSHDSLRVIERLRSLRDQHAKDLEQDMDEKQTAATRSQIRLLDQLIEEFTPAD